MFLELSTSEHISRQLQKFNCPSYFAIRHQQKLRQNFFVHIFKVDLSYFGRKKIVMKRTPSIPFPPKKKILASLTCSFFLIYKISLKKYQPEYVNKLVLLTTLFLIQFSSIT